MKARHINIPVFVPHLGCPNTCVFCNQRTISGKSRFSLSSVREDIDTVMSTVTPYDTVELAFFGGSFTGIDRALMLELLNIGREYVECGKISAMRCSTRPDYISEEILSILREYGMKTIELGIQSVSDRVLSASKRGHTFETTKKACEMVVSGGFSLVGQMMIGLPEATIDDEIKTAEFIADIGALGARVYPTAVFEETELKTMAENGSYTPLTVEDAVIRTRDVLDVFDKRGVNVIRVGLCAGEGLDSAVCGVKHSAVGELARGALYLSRIEKVLDGMEKTSSLAGKNIIVEVAKGRASACVSQKRCNIVTILQKYSLNRVKVLENSAIIGYNIIVRYDR